MGNVGHAAVSPVGLTSAGARAWRHRGVLRVTVIAKATFAFAADGLMTRVEPLPLFQGEVTHGKGAMQSVRFAGDVAPYLQQAEILFTGRGHTPGGHPLEHMPVRLGVFDGAQPILDKMLMLREKGGFSDMAITYERAYGGIGFPDNPLGMGALPDTGEPTVLDPFDDKRFAGFGPIGMMWNARKKLLGSLPRKALDADPIELPDDFDFTYFQAAPADQRVLALRGDEWIVMDGLHPTTPRFRTRLPGARGLARVYGLSRWGVVEGQPLSLHADTLHIDGAEQRATLTFRGVFPLVADEARGGLRIVAGVELPGEPIAWPSPDELPAPAAPALAPEARVPVKLHDSISITLSGEEFESVEGVVFDGTLTIEPDPQQKNATLPFRPGVAPPSIAQASPRSPESRRARAGGGTLPIDDAPDFGPVLPFRAPGAPAPAPDEAARKAASEAETKATTPSPKAASPAPDKQNVWAPAAPEAPKGAPPPKAQPVTPTASPKLKKGLYGKFGGS